MTTTLDEDVLNIRLTGREVHKAVANYVKDHLRIDPQQIINEATNAARQAAKDAVFQFVKDNLSGEKNIEWYVQRAIASYVEQESKRAVYQEFERVAKKMVNELRDNIESEFRKSLLEDAQSIINKVVKVKS